MDAPIPPNDREPKGSWSRTLVLPRVTRRDPRARRDALIGAAVAICLGLIFLTPQFGGSLIALSYDLAYKFRPKATINEAVLVYMDDESHGVLKQPYDQGWDRRVHARMVNRLMSYGAQAVVFDVLFRDDRTNSASGRLEDSEDGEFMAALRASGHVVLGATVQRKSYGTIGKVAEMIGPTPNLQTVAHVGLAEAGLKELREALSKCKINNIK